MTTVPEPTPSRTLYMLALDPSFRATGWAVLNLGPMQIVALGVIQTAKAKATERLLAAADDGRAGLVIRRAVKGLLEEYLPIVVAQEANTGSKSAKAAKQLARAQQACCDACDEHLGAMPMMHTPQAVKKGMTGAMGASKDEVEAAVRKHWPEADFNVLLAGVAPKKRENAFDALAVAYVASLEQQVASLRKLARP